MWEVEVAGQGRAGGERPRADGGAPFAECQCAVKAAAS